MKLFRFQLSRDDLEKRMGGGIPSGTLGVIYSYHGGGKSIFCQRLTYGFLQNMKTVTYISTQMTTKDFINQMYSLDYPVSKYLINGDLLYIPIYPLISEKKEANNYLEIAMNTKALYEKDVIIFDTISTLIRYDNETKLEDFLSFLKKICALEKVVLLTISLEEIDEDVLDKLKSLSTLVIEMEQKMVGGEMKNFAKIIKYNMPSDRYQKIIPFRVEPRIGFVVEISAVV